MFIRSFFVRTASRLAALGLVLAAACRDGSAPPKPASLVASDSTATAVVATVVANAPTFTIRDAGARPIGGAPVTVVVGEGGGTVRNAPSRSLAGGTPVGTWTLGTRTGRNTLIVSTPGVPPLVLVATGTADEPIAIQSGEAAGQEAFAGTELPRPVSALVTDRFGNGVGGVLVRFAVVEGSGALSGDTATTSDDGVATGPTWRLGAQGGPQRARAAAGVLSTELTAEVKSDYRIDVRFAAGPPSAELQQAFRAASDRLRAAIVGDVADARFDTVNVSGCGADPGTILNETVDDVIIYAALVRIDGPGRVLARAGPCFVRATSLHTSIGTMQFDIDDTPALIASGRFQAVVTHEMLHVVGIGSLWRSKGLVQGSGSGDPRFSGATATARCDAMGFTTDCAAGVPLENIGSSGTVEVHWRESVFNSELMTGYVEATPDMPLSSLTVAALDDFGYRVNLFGSDPFSFLTVSGNARRAAPPSREVWELSVPIRVHP